MLWCIAQSGSVACLFISLLNHFLEAAQQLHESVAGILNCAENDLCFCPVESLLSTIKFASWFDFTVCEVVADSS